ncbi:MAG: OsmC family protein [Thermoflexales bacterium]|nr:OsmC family protein [Thermoflexales bacterium]
MSIAKANAVWNGTLKEGAGTMALGSGAYKGAYTWASRFADGKGTNPEELIGAAHAGCFSMFLSALLTKNGTPPAHIHTDAAVTLGDGPTITAIALTTEAEVAGITVEKFNELVAAAKQNCPVSKALASVPSVTVKATLKG